MHTTRDPHSNLSVYVDSSGSDPIDEFGPDECIEDDCENEALAFTKRCSECLPSNTIENLDITGGHGNDPCPNCGYCPHCGRGGHPNPRGPSPIWMRTPPTLG